MANFEAFLQSIKLSIYLLFLKSVTVLLLHTIRQQKRAFPAIIGHHHLCLPIYVVPRIRVFRALLAPAVTGIENLISIFVQNNALALKK